MPDPRTITWNEFKDAIDVKLKDKNISQDVRMDFIDVCNLYDPDEIPVAEVNYRLIIGYP